MDSLASRLEAAGSIGLVDLAGRFVRGGRLEGRSDGVEDETLWSDEVDGCKDCSGIMVDWEWSDDESWEMGGNASRADGLGSWMGWDDEGRATERFREMGLVEVESTGACSTVVGSSGGDWTSTAVAPEAACTET